LESSAKYAASRVRRFARFLHNSAVDPKEWYKPLVQSILKDWPADMHLYIALDTTVLTPFVLIRVSLIYRGRAIPLAWLVLLHASTKVSFADYQPVLDQQEKVRRWVDTHWDRGLSYLKIGWRWMRQCYRRGWQVFASFWLDPAPDLVPAIASRRAAISPKRQWIVHLQC